MNRAVGRHHGDLRRALIAAAVKLTAESGPDDVTLRAVAREAGVSAAAPYHHFADKDALLAAVARDGFDSLVQVQTEVLGRSGSARAKLERLVERYVRFATDHQTQYRLMFRTPPTDITGAESAALQQSALASFENLVAAIRAADPVLSADQAATKAVFAWALAHGAVDVQRWGRALQPGLTPDAFAAEVGRSVGRLVLG